nr:zinc finger BED domain-containing protein RICESLEEPER 2-like [Ipomoea trifida]
MVSQSVTLMKCGGTDGNGDDVDGAGIVGDGAIDVGDGDVSGDAIGDCDGVKDGVEDDRDSDDGGKDADDDVEPSSLPRFTQKPDAATPARRRRGEPRVRDLPSRRRPPAAGAFLRGKTSRPDAEFRQRAVQTSNLRVAVSSVSPAAAATKGLLRFSGDCSDKGAPLFLCFFRRLQRQTTASPFLRFFRRRLHGRCKKFHICVSLDTLLIQIGNFKSVYLVSCLALPPPHTGVDIIDGVMKSTKDWGIEHKIFTISVDNASNNDVAVRIAKETFSRSHKLPLGGKLFHVRCTAHILNLVVQDGLSTIKSVVDDVRNSVRFINQSESRLLKFSEIVHHLGNPVKKLILDCVTRWNSTYEMLVVAIKVKDAFPIFAQREPSYKCCPSLEDWSKIEHVLSILEVFYEATQVISGTTYPTSNVFLGVVWRAKHVLNENEFHHEELIRDMIEKMKTKFDKYWGDCNLLMSIGAILDPRYKMRLVDFAFNQIYNANDARINVMKVRDALHDLFYEYVEMDNMKTRKGSSSMQNVGSLSITSSCSTSKGKVVLSGLSLYDKYLDTVEDVTPSKSELDIYLEEGVYRCQDGEVTSEFDALAWWKSHELKFSILSKLARDVLAIPISTVASEATFSAGTRVLDPYRAKLSSDMVQVLANSIS